MVRRSQLSGGVGDGAPGSGHAVPALWQCEELRLRPQSSLHAVRQALVDHRRHRDGRHQAAADHMVPSHAPDEQHQAVHLCGRTRRVDWA